MKVNLEKMKIFKLGQPRRSRKTIFESLMSSATLNGVSAKHKI